MLSNAISMKLNNYGIEQMLKVNRQRHVFAYPERDKPEMPFTYSRPKQG